MLNIATVIIMKFRVMNFKSSLTEGFDLSVKCEKKKKINECNHCTSYKNVLVLKWSQKIEHQQHSNGKAFI